MRALSLLVLLALPFGLIAQSADTIHLSLRHLFAGSPIVKDTASYNTNAGLIDLTLLQYYMSNVSILHDSGQVTSLGDTVHLVNRENTNLELGIATGIDSIEAIRFDIGVGAAYNHLDPATYSSGHPLAYQIPSMHWGWQAGYLFFTIDGMIDTDSNGVVDNSFSYHVIGDKMRSNVTVPLGSTVVKTTNKHKIELSADYFNVFDGFTSIPGLAHGSYPQTNAIVANYSKIFGAGHTVTTGVESLVYSADIDCYYNNMDKMLVVKALADEGQERKVLLLNQNGSVVLQQSFTTSANILLSENYTAGLYVAVVFEGMNIVKVHKLLLN